MSYLKDQLEGFVPKEQQKEILKEVTKGSTLLKLSKVEPMKSDRKSIPVLTEGPGAYWVGEGERIQTSNAQWIHPELVAKKIAVIMPVTKEKLSDTVIDVFKEITPEIAKAFYLTIDGAGLFGINSPFAKSLFGVAEASENLVVNGTGESFDIDVSNAMALVEEAGHDVTGYVGHRGIKNTLRTLRDTNGNQIYVPGVTQNELYGSTVEFASKGGFDKTKADLIMGNFDYSLVGIREGIKYEILKEATLHSQTMPDGKPLSLAENDMIAIKATMRLGFLPIKEDAFAAITPKATTQG
ncbi:MULTISPECIES: phage major capsid protein [Bacillus]|uniref:phage major capsid protein n=1 Tax=Bacillus TaxID=1386 RepID=UPI001ABCD9D8|nr:MULTISPECIES: phage major capsid protein [Bacillus subtilis group]MBO3635112.1 phage major capsid protein [Bacillus subtilis]MDH3118534.1 phage major capsid protein [Bacillus subtilis]MDH3148597.1 phage major capsid protein [Bacillus subtilis]MEC1634760.1 phage major capsid protein [Bacillus mojavensis]MEC1683708.1 phage major capsid protein [Bacillus mojavensis]